MTAREQGYLLLTAQLGDTECKPLTLPQLYKLAKAVSRVTPPTEDRDLALEDLLAVGLDREFSRRVLSLLDREEQLQWYLKRASRGGCAPVTRIGKGYPDRLRKLGKDAPAVLWGKGNWDILQKRCVSVVGSRELLPDNMEFAYEAGKQAALQGYVMVSGNARGADRTAQDACLDHGGCVISVVPGSLADLPERQGVLYLSEEGADSSFTPYRALRRNRIIHALGEKTFVAQCTLEKGGTWDGTRNNLRTRLSPVWCCDDGSEAARELAQMGAGLLSKEQLKDFSALKELELNFMDADS